MTRTYCTRAEVMVGSRYGAKISGRIVEVEVVAEHPHGGWVAVSRETGRTVRIHTARKLRPLGEKDAGACG